MEAMNWEDMLRCNAERSPFRVPLTPEECRQALECVEAARAKVAELEKEIENLKEKKENST